MDSHAVHIWQGEVAATETDCPHYWRILDDSEKAQADSIKNEYLRKHYVEVRAILRILLGHTVHADPHTVRIHKTEHGKPYLVDYPELAFNLSHTDNRMIVAIAYNCLLGVDIEYLKLRANCAAVVNKCFADEEKAYWQQLPQSQQTQAFYHFWTRKEAFVKATGRGIAIGLKRCVLNPEKTTEFLRIPDGFGGIDDWMVGGIDWDESICGAFAINNQDTKRMLKNMYLSWDLLADVI
ncbi:MAG: 4'-phosphopantetheinyl transferase superfamily protein [Methyloglobulus sp.]|nr:4'-phosphopantetheinyl transferase superfamily protein [Methyloglobulus sp.]